MRAAAAERPGCNVSGCRPLCTLLPDSSPSLNPFLLPLAQLAIMLDTKGPEIRTGFLEDGKSIDLKEGQVSAAGVPRVVGP